MRRLRNSTWRGTHDVPHCGTRTVLVDNHSSSRAARRVIWEEKKRAARFAGFEKRFLKEHQLFKSLLEHQTEDFLQEGVSVMTSGEKELFCGFAAALLAPQVLIPGSMGS